MVNINKLLKQKGWTGEELGILELTNVLTSFSKVQAGEKDPKPLISKAEFRRMLDTIKDPAEGRRYNGYLSIHDWISRVYSMAVSQEQQAQARYNSLLYYATNADIAEHLYQYIAELPAIMTEKQYKELREKRIEEAIHPDGGRAALNAFNLIEQAIDYFINQLQKNPRKSNPLKPLKKKLEKELVTDPRILSRYNVVMGNGYYTLPDGRRSDQMTQEEWEKAIISPEFKEAMEDEEKAKEYSFDKRIQIAREIYSSGKTEEEIQHELTEQGIEEGRYQRVEWHYYEEPPKDLTKWEILETGDLGEYYRSLWSQTPEGEEIPLDKYDEYVTADAEAFKKEFPELTAAILKDMEANGATGIASAPVADWVEFSISFEDLYKNDVYGWRDTYTSDTHIFEGNGRAIFNGIAIIRPSDIGYCRSIDENGYYKAPNISGLVDTFSLGAFFTDSEEYAKHTDVVEGDRKTLLDSLYWINGYNTALDLIADYYRVEAIKLIKIDISGLIKGCENWNDFIAMLYKQVKNTDYEDKEIKQKKLEVLKDIFYPIDLDSTKIPNNKIAIAKSYLKNFHAFTEPDCELTTVLCFRDRGAD